MSKGFGTHAAGLSSLAARALGWRPPDFWQATPAELLAALTDPAQDTASFDRAALERLMEQDRHG
uniref:phage tail assembly chaperone n=1 Tax=Parerythrobacter lutipelagi TaxID=1964208 RepID=UPI0010FA0020|nr:phage tail assembly chaperone [Parerythrobacter lutipelagi]